MDNPSYACAALFRRKSGMQANAVGDHIGSGFVVDADPKILVTAKHVVQAAGDHDIVAVFPFINEDPPILQTRRWYSHPHSDVAAAELLDPDECTQGFALADDTPLNTDVCSIEYSPTRHDSSGVWVLHSFRRGHVVRRDLAPAGPASGRPVLLLSYPALRGASGSPVFDATTKHVHGMLIANVEQELMPAQVETVTDDEGKAIEERKYFLPEGQAVRVGDIEEAVSQIRSGDLA